MSLEGRLVVLLVAAGLLVAFVWGWRTTRVGTEIEGISHRGAMTPAAIEDLTVRIGISPAARAAEAVLTLNGRDLTDEVTIEGGALAWVPGELAEGEHLLELEIPRPILPSVTKRWAFVVDGTPPRIDVPPYLPPRGMDDPVEIEGRVVNGEQLTVNGEPYELARDGSFRITYDTPPPGPVELVATDRAGNRRNVNVYAPIEFPDDIRGVHVTASGWDNAGLRQGIIDLIDAGVVNAVILSLKDEGGLVGHVTDVPLAREIGAALDLYDLRRQVEFLEDRGVRLIGRIVAFRDPKLAEAAWARGDRDLVIQDPEGGRYMLYGGGFTNFAHDEVQRYNIELAVEAVEAGVPDILWDYVRRPDGFLESMYIPGLGDHDPADVIVDFLRQSHERVRELGAVQGASVFGIAATRPEQIAQNILHMAGHSDYIAPMLYPSHWNPGEYGLADPESDPYEIVLRSMRDFQQQVARTGRPILPWLQHFSLRVSYGPAEVRAQIRASAEMGSESWLMWNPAVVYNPDALRP